MTTPFMVPFQVDVVRFGGSQATHRHGFGGASISSTPPPPPLPPPPPPVQRIVRPPSPVRVYLGESLPDILGQGKPTAPALNPDTLNQIRSAAGNAAETLRYELEAVKVERDMVSGQALRTEPDLYKSIAIVGPYLTPREIRNVIINDARAIQGQAQRLLSGAAAPYITAGQRAILSTVVSDAKAEIDYMQNFDLTPLTGANAKLAQDHTETHVKASRDVIDSIERAIVSGEAASVPVREPGESGGGPGALIAVGALVAVTVLLVELL